MKKTTTLLAGLAVALVAVGCNAYDEENFSATLNATNVVPAPATTEAASGTFSLTFKGPVAEWSLTIPSGIPNVTGVHIHNGAAGVTQTGGTLDVVLYDGPIAGGTAPSFSSAVHGSFINDQVAACATAPANAGAATCEATNTRTYDNIHARAALGTVFVDVHSAANNNGALRGQIQ